jgi:hypothetical protein
VGLTLGLVSSSVVLGWTVAGDLLSSEFREGVFGESVGKAAVRRGLDAARLGFVCDPPVG